MWKVKSIASNNLQSVQHVKSIFDSQTHYDLTESDCKTERVKSLSLAFKFSFLFLCVGTRLPRVSRVVDSTLWYRATKNPDVNTGSVTRPSSRSSGCSFAHIAHSFACSKLLAHALHCAHLFAHLLTCSLSPKLVGE